MLELAVQLLLLMMGTFRLFPNGRSEKAQHRFSQQRRILSRTRSDFDLFPLELERLPLSVLVSAIALDGQALEPRQRAYPGLGLWLRPPVHAGSDLSRRHLRQS